MDLNAIASEICDQADGFLEGVTKRDEAKAGIAEFLTIHYGRLTPTERTTVTEQAMQILEKEGFFDRDAGEGKSNPADGE